MAAPAALHDSLEPGPVTDFQEKIFPQTRDEHLLGKSGTLEVRLARTAKDIKRAQKLRYRVFYEEMGAISDPASRQKQRDIDPFDAICDHLLVMDTAAFDTDGPAKNQKSLSRKPRIVGTYRLLRHEIAARHGGFYSAQEFDLAPLFARHPHKRFLELGRSCVEPNYRDKRSIELLWHGIWAYVRLHQIDALFGCASFAGTDPAQLVLPLSFLHHHAQAKPEWQIEAQKSRACAFDPLPIEQIDMKTALQDMPPLIKAYMRVGARFGRDVVIDHQFGTTDVLVILPVSDIHPKYLGYFGHDGQRYAA